MEPGETSRSRYTGSLLYSLFPFHIEQPPATVTKLSHIASKPPAKPCPNGLNTPFVVVTIDFPKIMAVSVL